MKLIKILKDDRTRPSLADKSRALHFPDWAEARYGDDYHAVLERGQTREISESINPNIKEPAHPSFVGEQQTLTEIDEMNKANIDELLEGRKKNVEGGRVGYDQGGQLVDHGPEGVRQGYGGEDELGHFLSKKTSSSGTPYYYVFNRETIKGKRQITVAKSFPEDKLKEAIAYRDDKLGHLIEQKISNKKYLELRNSKKDLTNKEFAEYLNTETKYRPIGENNKWTNSNVKGRNQIVGFESDVYRISDDVKKVVFVDYQKQVKAGKTNLKELARKHFPDSSIPLETRQKRIYSILTKDYGVDRSEFKTEFDPESPYRSKQKVRFKRNKIIQEALNKAGETTKAQYLQLESQILDLNKHILEMSDKDILNNKALMRALNVDASVENLNKGKITFDKYAHLSDKQQVAKIRQLADAGTFFQPEHITEVVTGKQSIVYPKNLQVASGKVGSYMSNIKKYVKDNPNGPAIPAIKDFLNEFDLAVREGGQKLGVQNIVYDSKTGTSSIVDMASKKMQNVTADMFDFRKLPENMRHFTDVTKKFVAQSPKFLNAFKKARTFGKWTGAALAAEPAFAAPFAEYGYKMGESPERILGDATFGLFGETEQEELRKAVGERGYATQQIDNYGSTLQALEEKWNSLNDQNDPRGETRQVIKNMYKHTRGKYNKAYNMFVDEQGEFDKGLYDQALNNYTAGLVQIDKFKKQKQAERIEQAGGYDNILQEREIRDIKGFAGGGLTRTVAPDSGPVSRGLRSLYIDDMD